MPQGLHTNFKYLVFSIWRSLEVVLGFLINRAMAFASTESETESNALRHRPGFTAASYKWVKAAKPSLFSIARTFGLNHENLQT